MAKIATGTGDKGTTALADGSRLSKAHDRVEAYGTIDELSSVLGVVASLGHDAAKWKDTTPVPLPKGMPSLPRWIARVQTELLVLGTDLSTPTGDKLPRIGAEEVARLDGELDLLEDALPPQRNFLLPGGCPSAAYLHQARAITRRAERCAWRLAESVHPTGGDPSLNEHALVYLNRLSDLLYLWARWENHSRGIEETLVPVHAYGRPPGGRT